MKKLQLTLTLLLSLMFTVVHAQTTALPDANFEQQLIDLGFDTNGITGNILNTDAAAVTALNVTRTDITDFTGLEAFVNLVTLNAGTNQFPTLPLTTLTVLEELRFRNNQALASLDVTQNAALRIFEIRASRIAPIPTIPSLNFSQNLALETLNVSTFESITSLTFPVTTTLTDIDVAQLSVPVIDLSLLEGDIDFRIVGSRVNVHIIYPNLNTALKRLELNSIDFPTVDVSPMIGLERFELSSTSTESFQLPNTNTLTSIRIWGHEINVPVDLSIVPQLTNLDIRNNYGSTPLQINLASNLELTSITLEGDLMNSVDLTQNTKVTRLDVSRNNLTSLDVTQNTLLNRFSANNNQLATIDLSQNLEIEYLRLHFNQFPSLDVTDNIELKILNIGNNLFTGSGLDLTQNAELMILYADNNQIESLNIDQNAKLRYLDISYNLFPGNEIINDFYDKIVVKANLSDVVFRANNNLLTGAIPDFHSIYTNNNPSTTQHRRWWFNIENNYFHFEDFENQHLDLINLLTTQSIGPSADVVMKEYTYAPQAKVNAIESPTRNAGESITFTTTVRGAQNHYKWFKDGVEIVDAADSPEYTITDLNTCDAGVYHSEITSDLVPFENGNPPGTDGKNLLLIRNDITLTVNATKDCVTLASPVNGATNIPINTGIEWNDNPGACGYKLSVGTTSGATDIVNNEDVGEVTVYNFASDLPSNQQIFVTITPYFDDGDFAGCTEETFTTNASTVAPECTTLGSPENGDTDVSIDLSSITWNPANGADAYRIEITSTSGNNNMTLTDVGNALTHPFSTSFQNGDVVTVNIIPYNAVGNAIGPCSMQSFTIGSASPSVPASCADLASPLANATDVAVDIGNISWDAVAGATAYRITINGSTSTVNDVVDQDITGTSFTLPGNFNSGETVSVTVIPFNTTGDAIGCDTPQTFTIGTAAVANAFITTWKTDNPGTSAANQITIPTQGTGYNYTVDWGDGNTTTGETGDATHTYLTPGTYTVSITGIFPRIYFAGNPFGNGDKDKILTIEQWGNNTWTSMDRAFEGCENLQGNFSDTPDLSIVTSMERMFKDCRVFNSDISNWNVSSVTNMSYLFNGAYVFNQPVDSWNVSNVTDMTAMFKRARAFNQDLNSWNVGNVTNMTGLFHFTDNFNGNISSWNVSSVTTMREIFAKALLFNQDIGSWNVSNVTSMQNAFDDAEVFNQDIGNWNVGNVNYMLFMFNGARNFNQDIGNWNVSQVINFTSMFNGAISFNQDISGWNTSSATSMQRMFGYANSFDQDLGSWNVENITNAALMFSNISLSMANYDALLVGWNAQNLQPNVSFDGGNSQYCVGAAARANMLSSDSWTITDGGPAAPTVNDLADQNHVNTYTLPAITGTQLTGTEAYFTENDGGGTRYEAGNTINFVDFPSYPVTLYIYDGSGSCSSEESFQLTLTTLTLPTGAFVTTWETTAANETITIPTRPFFGTYDYTVDWGDGTTDTNVAGDITHTYSTPGTQTISITGTFPQIYFNGTAVDRDKILTIEQWGDIEWQALTQAFKGCSRLNITNTAIDIPNLSLTTNISEAFADATSFNGDITQWNVNTIINMANLFQRASSFNQDIGNWDVSNALAMARLFEGATAFNQDIGDWDVGNVVNMGIMFVGASSFNQDIGRWNVSNVTDMNTMFGNAVSFNQDIGNWNVSSVINMNQMFYGATDFNQDINFKAGLGIPSGDAWNTSNVTSMVVMFYNATSFNQNIGNWNVENVTSALNMFRGATLSTANYDALLIGWNAQNLQANVPFSGGNSQYCEGATARANMISNDTWAITDGGLAGPTVDDLVDQNEANSYTLPTIAGTQLTGSEAYYTEVNGGGTRYEADDVINFADFPSYPITLYIYDGSGSCSSEESFQLILTNTTPSLPNCTTLTSPLDNATDITIATDLIWNAVSNADGYRISIGTTVGGTEIVSNEDVGNLTTYNPTNDFAENTTIYVSIIPYNATGDATGCTEESFTTVGSTATVPNCTTLSSPLNNASDVAVATDLTWNAISNADGYRISIGTTVGGTEIVNNEDVGNLTTYNPTNDFAENTTIYVRITSYNATGDAVGCTEESFTTVSAIATVPNCTTLTSPLDNATYIAIATDLTWNAVSNADGYRISIGTTVGGTEIVNNEDVGNLTTYNPTNDFAENTTIYVRITPYNATGDAVGCTEESFTTVSAIATVPNCTTLTSPLDNATDIAIATDLTWNAVSDVDGYRISIGTTAGGTEIVNNEDVGNLTTYNPTNDFAENTTIYVSITPYNATGDAVGCTEESFTTEIIEDQTKYGFSPNGDGKNDDWQIVGIENYLDNVVSIYNRWGDLVYQIKGYNNNSKVFNGTANRLSSLGARKLPSGTYFFDIQISGSHKIKKLKGYLILKR